MFFMVIHGQPKLDKLDCTFNAMHQIRITSLVIYESNVVNIRAGYKSGQFTIKCRDYNYSFIKVDNDTLKH